MRSILSLLAMLGACAYDVAIDETLDLRPGWLRVQPDGSGILELSAWLGEHDLGLSRRAALSAFRHHVGLDEDDAAVPLFAERAWRFVADSDAGRPVTLTLGSKEWPLGVTNDDGVASAAWTIPSASVAALLAAPQISTLPPRASQPWPSAALVITPASGIAVITDLDDTIKQTNVLEKTKLMHRVFCEPWTSVPGMAQVLRTWSASGASLHVVSGSPWPLYPALANWWHEQDLPAATWDLRQARMGDGSILSLRDPPEAHKLAAIAALLGALPRHHFVLIGDTGERDPEIYAAIYHAQPARVLRILLHAVRGETRSDERLRNALAGIPDDPVQLVPLQP